ncbi:hypothetical protein C8R44DRAFT_877545 [Mycena epipterygia]|nr:hypothetical protein C8R44DRAFT_877545 [Mycena epipterygia]
MVNHRIFLNVHTHVSNNHPFASPANILYFKPKDIFLRARVYCAGSPSPAFTSIHTRALSADPQATRFPCVESVMNDYGFQPHVHDIDVELRHGRSITRFRVFFKRHVRLPQNGYAPIMGDIVIMRVSTSNLNSVVNMRSTDRSLSDFVLRRVAHIISSFQGPQRSRVRRVVKLRDDLGNGRFDHASTTQRVVEGNQIVTKKTPRSRYLKAANNKPVRYKYRNVPRTTFVIIPTTYPPVQQRSRSERFSFPIPSISAACVGHRHPILPARPSLSSYYPPVQQRSRSKQFLHFPASHPSHMADEDVTMSVPPVRILGSIVATPPKECSSALPSDTNIEDTSSVHAAPARESLTTEKQAVTTPGRERFDQKTEEAMYAKEKAKEERDRRKKAEEEVARLKARITELEGGGMQNMEQIVQDYIKRFEADCDGHYKEQIGLVEFSYEGRLETLQSSLAEARAEAAEARAEAARAAARAEAARAEAHTISNDDIARRLREEQRKMVEMKADLAQKDQTHEKAMASKEEEIMAMIARLRATRPFNDSNEQPEFPPNAPHLLPRFITPQTQRARMLGRVFKSASGRIPVLPGMPSTNGVPSTSGVPEEVLAFDDQNSESIEAVKSIVKSVLSELGIVSVNRTKTKKEKNVRAPTKMALDVREQQSKMTHEQDLCVKRALREVWRKTYNCVNEDQFSGYEPASLTQVERCNEGLESPDEEEYTLDFSSSFMSSLWNKEILERLTSGFMDAIEADPNHFGLPQISREYVLAEFYGKLKRAQEWWARWQPRYSVAGATQETDEEKFTRRMGTVENVIEIKTVKNEPDLESWKFLLAILNHLDVAGMSSEDSEAGEVGGQTVQIFRVRLCAWRALPVTDYLRIIDDTATRMKPSKAHPRIRGSMVGRSNPPKGLPTEMYNEEWLSQARASRPRFVEELRISKEAFNMLAVATSTLV